MRAGHLHAVPPARSRVRTDKLDAFLEALDKGAILETVRTGVSGIGRGEWVLKA